MSSNRVMVFLRGQEISHHQSSHTFAARLVSALTARWKNPLTKKEIEILTRESWREIKTRFRGTSTFMPALLPPRRPETLMLSYPPRNYESDGNAKQKHLWLTAERF